MSKRRCIPTNLFFQPRFVALSSDTTRLLLIGLITDADDFGRGLADSRLLARKLDHAPESVEAAMQELEGAQFVQRYGTEEEWYYALCAWNEWQTLSKPTPSKYPAPPVSPKVSVIDSPEQPTIPPETPEKFRDMLREEEEELNRTEDEGEGEPNEQIRPHNVVTFPANAAADTVDTQTNATHEMTRVIARILKLKSTEALERIVLDYGQSSQVSLLGEADAAREWIEDRRRNRNGQRMTPAFFRRWLKKEMEAVQRHEVDLERQRHTQGTGTDGGGISTGYASSAPHATERPPLPNLMNLETHYRRAMQGGES